MNDVSNTTTVNQVPVVPEPPTSSAEGTADSYCGAANTPAPPMTPVSAYQVSPNQASVAPEASAPAATVPLASTPVPPASYAFRDSATSYPYTPEIAPVPLQSLSAGMKACWLLVGLGLSFYGVILAWLVNIDRASKVKTDAVVWSAVGFAINFIFGLFAFLFFFFVLFTL